MTTDARDARGLAEEGFQEIQLTGKQLVFLFMATTVVSIVIFLCGVLVGRGVRGDAPTESTPVAAAARPDAAPPTGAEAPPADANAQGTELKAGELNYHEALTRDQQKPETLKPAEKLVEKPAEPPAPVAETTPATPPPAPAPAPSAAAPATTAAVPAAAAATPAVPAAKPPARPAGAFTVQVAALGNRNDADVIVRRLAGRGFDAYLLDPGPGAPLYRVRVGTFKDRREAEKVMKRLAQEEKFKPWITR